MDEGKFAADFFAKNVEKIFALGKQAITNLDEKCQIALKSAYTTYLTTTREKYAKSKSFFIRHQPVDLYSYYVPTGVSCREATINIPTFRELINHAKRVVLKGTGGSGKSILTKHLFLDCIRDGEFAPILIELRDLNTDNTSLDDHVNHTLDCYGFKTSGEYVARAKKAGHFCYFLDGYDEVNLTRRPRLLKEINSLSKKYGNCPVVISTRPDD